MELQGHSRGGGSWGACEPPFCKPFFNQTTYNRWRKCHDDTLAIVTIWWVPSLWHCVTPLWKILATPLNWMITTCSPSQDSFHPDDQIPSKFVIIIIFIIAILETDWITCSMKEGCTGVFSWCMISSFYFLWNVNLGNYSSWLVTWRFCVIREEPGLLTDICDFTTPFYMILGRKFSELLE